MRFEFWNIAYIYNQVIKIKNFERGIKMKIKVSNYEIQSDVAREAFLTFDFEDIVKKLDLK